MRSGAGRLRLVRTALVCAFVLALVSCSQVPVPNRDEMVGSWQYSARESSAGSAAPAAEVELNADGKVIVKDFPMDTFNEDTLIHTAVSAAEPGSYFRNFLPTRRVSIISPA